MVNFSSVHNKFKLLCASGTFGLEVTNLPWTLKVLGSNLTEPEIFLKPEVVLSADLLTD